MPVQRVSMVPRLDISLKFTETPGLVWRFR